MGGAQENTLSTALGLHAMSDYQVRLISGPTSGPEGSLEDKASAVPGLFQICPTLIRSVRPLTDRACVADLTREFKKHRPDIVHTHSGKAGILGRLAARKAGVPLIIHTIHGPSFGDFQGALANWIFRTAEKLADRWTDHFITVSQAMSDQYLAAGIGFPEKFTRIWSGFNLDPYLRPDPNSSRTREELRRQIGVSESDLVIGTIARLFELKGHDEILDVAQDLLKSAPNVHFLWIGDGVWRGRLEERIRSMGLEKRVHLTGLVPPESIPDWIRAMDLLAHLSRREGLPRALPQSLACGKPVVAFDCDGAREICVTHQTGFLVTPGDSEGLKESLKALCLNQELRQSLGERGQRWTEERFSDTGMVQAIHLLYQKLWSDKKCNIDR